MGRSFETILKENRRAVLSFDTNNALSVHCLDNNHFPDFDNFQILKNCQDLRLRRVFESAFISSDPHSVNFNPGFAFVDPLTSHRVLRSS